MAKTLRVQVQVVPLPLSRRSIDALRHLSRYDVVAFTSKNARTFFNVALQKRKIPLPRREQILHVGPRNDLLKHAIDNKRILFPRSDIAPSDILSAMRTRGAVVTTIPLYTTVGAPLSRAERIGLMENTYTELYFRSPSGIHGFLAQLRGTLRKKVLTMSVQCIGDTTAKAARKAGFRKISITGVL